MQWRRVVEPGLLAAGSASVFAIVYYATVRTEPGRLLGDASLRGALLVNSEFATFVDSLLGLIPLAALLGGIAGIAMIALLRENRVLGVVAVGLVVGASVSTWLLKNVLLSRPDLGLSEVTPATHNSLPSGHVTAVFSVFVALLIVLPPWWRDAAGTVGAVVGAITVFRLSRKPRRRRADTANDRSAVPLPSHVTGARVPAGHRPARPEFVAGQGAVRRHSRNSAQTRPCRRNMRTVRRPASDRPPIVTGDVMAGGAGP